jgi:F-type H+-transporting ATPase subunit b
MSVLGTTIAATSRLLPGAEHGVDDKGYTSHSWIWPEQAELIYGTLASVIIIGLLVWKAGPFAKKAFNDRTAKVQGELDDSAQAQTDAEAEAARIRQALGDIESERSRLLAEADAQAEALVADGRTRLAAEIADMEAKADADIASAGSRVADELRLEISRLAASAADQVVANSLDDATQQRLVEDYIARVGASA